MWIDNKTPPEQQDALKEALEVQAALYPVEYRTSVDALNNREAGTLDESIVMSHGLIPGALKHAFATFGVLLSPDLPLSRRQHEMIASTVSSANSCFY